MLIMFKLQLKKKLKKKEQDLTTMMSSLLLKNKKIQKISEDISKALNILTSATGKTVAKASANLFSANSSVKGICSMGSPSKSNTLVLKFQFVVTLATKTSAEKN